MSPDMLIFMGALCLLAAVVALFHESPGVIFLYIMAMIVLAAVVAIGLASLLA